MALPPRRMTSAPISLAIRSVLDTMPFAPYVAAMRLLGNAQPAPVLCSIGCCATAAGFDEAVLHAAMAVQLTIASNRMRRSRMRQNQHAGYHAAHR
jgi:hypothetical protein